ncbi:MAG: leucine-rich repeat domain-containing protein [Spirochaetaceae bacterium]|jgi:hypothetical protein|nr:leucine-rich repeat domain-containing protein [Spirochaetaceae bacterium]
MRKVLIIALFLCPFLLFAQDYQADYVVKDKVLVKYRGVSRNVVIPPKLGINRIGVRAFANTPVQSVVIPMGVGFIDERAFMGCSFLKDVTLPNTLANLGRRAFFNCSMLENINIPRSLLVIEDGAFFNCRSLKEIDIPDTLKSLGSRAFSGCLGLEKVSLSRRTKLGEHPFMGVSCQITFRE